jgi:hypothetical protein
VRVTSGIADVDFNVHSISRQGPYVVVRDREGNGPATVVYVSAQDIVAALKALLASPGALSFVLTAFFRRKAVAADARAARSATRDDVNNPWI